MLKLTNLILLMTTVVLTSCALHDVAIGKNDVSLLNQPEAVFATQDSAVGVESVTGGVTSSGGGVWLGNGKVLTATHLFLDRKSESDQIFVTWRGARLKAEPVFHGIPPDEDLILLRVQQESVPASLARIAPPQVCRDVESVGQRIYVTARDATYWTHTSPEGRITHKQKVWSNATTALLSHGVSGSPVYDGETSCLAGIVSRMHFSWGTNPNNPNQNACERATLQMDDSHLGGTCAIEPKTIFMTSEEIQKFLNAAEQYERSETAKKS